MSALLLIFVCLALGFVTARLAKPPPGTAHALNWWVLYIAFPALVLDQIPRLRFEWDLWFLGVMPWLMIAATWAMFAALGRLFGWSRSRTGALVLTCGFGNTSFMGYPMVEAMRGQTGLGYAVVYDQIGTFLAVSTVGIAVAALYSGQRARPTDIVKRIALFPPFLAMIVAVAVAAFGGWPEALDEVFRRLGSSLTPLALFSVGLQFSLKIDRSKVRPLLLGLGWKLAVTPALVYLIGRGAGVGGLPLIVGTLEAAMAPMISAGILAEEFGLEPPLANTVVGTGILISLASVPLVNLIL